MKILEETTVWQDMEQRAPNHVYLMHGDKAYAYAPWGTDAVVYLANPLRMDRRGRRFQEVTHNAWQFDVTMKVDSEPDPAPQGETWQVRGSKGNQYSVALVGGRWTCTCAGHGFRGHCRHVAEVSASVQP